MAWFLIKYLNNKYALTLRESVKKNYIQLSMACGTPLSEFQIKLTHDISWGPALLKLNQ